MARRATMRASDDDRERVAERLRKAAAEGRLLADELEERLGAAFSARTYGELDPLVADIPRTDAVHRPRSRTLYWLKAVPLPALIVFTPVLLALIMTAVVLITTLFTAWGFFLAVLWLAFGRHPRMYAARYGWANRYGWPSHPSARWQRHSRSPL